MIKQIPMSMVTQINVDDNTTTHLNEDKNIYSESNMTTRTRAIQNICFCFSLNTEHSSRDNNWQVEQMSNVLEQKINGRRRRSISVFFTVCRLLAGIYPETILDNLINEFPEYFNHLPHRPSRGHGFIRKFQN